MPLLFNATLTHIFTLRDLHTIIPKPQYLGRFMLLPKYLHNNKSLFEDIFRNFKAGAAPKNEGEGNQKMPTNQHLQPQYSTHDFTFLQLLQ